MEQHQSTFEHTLLLTVRFLIYGIFNTWFSSILIGFHQCQDRKSNAQLYFSPPPHPPTTPRSSDLTPKILAKIRACRPCIKNLTVHMCTLTLKQWSSVQRSLFSFLSLLLTVWGQNQGNAKSFWASRLFLNLPGPSNQLINHCFQRPNESDKMKHLILYNPLNQFKQYSKHKVAVF